MKITESNVKRLSFLIQKSCDKTLPRLKRYQANYLRLEMERRILKGLARSTAAHSKFPNGGIIRKGTENEAIIPNHEPVIPATKYEGKADFITAKLESLLRK